MRRILEIGMGTNNASLLSSMGRRGSPEASLRARKKYLPNSEICGTDVDKNILFQSGRITTSYVDQLDSTTFDTMFKIVALDHLI